MYKYYATAVQNIFGRNVLAERRVSVFFCVASLGYRHCIPECLDMGCNDAPMTRHSQNTPQEIIPY